MREIEIEIARGGVGVCKILRVKVTCLNPSNRRVDNTWRMKGSWRWLEELDKGE